MKPACSYKYHLMPGAETVYCETVLLHTSIIFFLDDTGLSVWVNMWYNPCLYGKTKTLEVHLSHRFVRHHFGDTDVSHHCVPAFLHSKITAKNTNYHPFLTHNFTCFTCSCGICKKNQDQHLLVLCDTCKLYYHLGCLEPPLTRMPKKTKNSYWWETWKHEAGGEEVGAIHGILCKDTWRNVLSMGP